MGPSTNWLSFSLSPMEMLRSSESQFMSYENSSTDSPHYLIDNFYTNGKNPYFFFFVSVCIKTLSPVWLLRSCRKRIYVLILLWKVYTTKYASRYGFRKVFIFIFDFLNGHEGRFLASNTLSDELTVFLICKSLTQILFEPRKKTPTFSGHLFGS